MFTVSAKLTFYIPHATTLKEKRQVCRSLIEKTKRRFNVCVAEVSTQDMHQTLTVGIAVVSGEAAYARNLMEEIIRYMENNADAELVEIDTIGV